MLILPYSTALRLNQIPYVTLTVIVLCLGVFFLQLQNRTTVENAVKDYCDSFNSEAYTTQKYDYMPKDKQYCYQTLYYMHSLNDINDWEEFYLKNYAEYDTEDELLEHIPFDLKHFYEFIDEGAPANFDVKIMYYPYSLNPFKMLSSALAHADWSHIIFNLIFFFAFTPALELLVGSKFKFLMVLVTISFSCGIFYSITSFINGSPIPTLGLSGVVMGMIGFSAYMMPHASIRTLVWFIFYVRNWFIPVWILAIWYIGWDIFDLFSRTDNGGTNFVAHVSGGLSGYIIARFFFKSRREDIQDELDDAIEYSRASRDSSRGMMSLHMGDRTRIDSDHRESQAKKEWASYKDRIYKLVMSGNASEVILTILKDYDINSKSPETYEELFTEIGQWRQKRSYFCVGRLLINLYLEQGKLGNAFTVLISCLKADPNFVLPDSSTVLMLATVAENKKQYKLAYHIVRDYKRRYFDSRVCVEHLVLEAKLLFQHLNRRDTAITLLKTGISSMGIYDAKELQALLDVIERVKN